jgi:hypothetical protein
MAAATVTNDPDLEATKIAVGPSEPPIIPIFIRFFPLSFHYFVGSNYCITVSIDRYFYVVDANIPVLSSSYYGGVNIGNPFTAPLNNIIGIQ